MKILNTGGQLVEQELGAGLAQPRPPSHFLVQLPATGQLQHDEEVVLAVNHVLQLDNVRVVQRFEDLGLVQQTETRG